MSTTTKNILIFGATGSIGEYITNAIVAKKSHFDRVAVFVS
jgi:FlaA1/EpsC-like NDP-sugar epimerase